MYDLHYLMNPATHQIINFRDSYDGGLQNRFINSLFKRIFIAAIDQIAAQPTLQKNPPHLMAWGKGFYILGEAGHRSNQPHIRSKGLIYFSGASTGQKPLVASSV